MTPDSAKFTTNLQIRVAPEEVEAWRAAADADGRTLSAWMRRTLNKAVAHIEVPQGTVEHTGK